MPILRLAEAASRNIAGVTRRGRHPVFARGVLLSLLAALALVLWPARHARAGEKESAAVVSQVDTILANDVANANFGEARKKLGGLLKTCSKKPSPCSGPATARVHVALGMISAQIGKNDDAKAAWFEAFAADPDAQLPSGTVSPDLKTKFEEVKKAWLVANPQLDDAQKAGWASKQAFEAAKVAVAAEQSGNWAECVARNTEALALEENLRARMHLALCEAKSGKIVAALRDNAKALETARTRNDTIAMKAIQERVTELLPKLARVKFELPKEVDDTKVVFDDRPIPPNRLAESFTIDPGTHSVNAEGVLRGVRVSYAEKVEAKEGETVVVKVTMKPAALTEGQLKCMVAAKTQEEILACLPSESKPLLVKAGLDVSAYTDTTAVHVLTPSVRGSVASPTAGWNVGASYLVDMVTAASPDLIASASRRFYDVRHAATATGGYKPGSVGGQVFGSYSEERDYISRTIGASATIDTRDKMITPALGYSFTWDTIGRAGTPYDVYSKPFNTHEVTAGSTFILSKTSLLVLGATAALESGDQSKPYRYVPVFEPGVSVPVGGSVDAVNGSRLAAKPLEQLPLDRQRFSIGARYVARVRANASLRLEERIYHDTWGTSASTTDARYLMDLSPRLRVWPHLHVHAQTGAQFYRRIYGATLNSDGSATIPAFRTTDRELSPMIGVTGGGGVRYQLTAPGNKFELALLTTADALYNQYVNSLYITNRLAFYGTLGVEAQFE